VANTYTWRVPRVDSSPLIDGIAMVFNESAGGEIEVIEVRITEPSETALTGGLFGAGAHELETISASSGGALASAVKFDTDSADLPAEIEFATSPLNITETITLRRLSDCPQFNSIPANAMRATRSYLRMGVPTAPRADSIWDSNVTFTSNEHLVLREGQGLAFIQRNGVLPHSMYVNLTVCVQSTGATYMFRSRDIGTMVTDRALWTLMNGVGSGEILEVCGIQMGEDGDIGLASTIPQPPTLRLIRTEGYIPTEGLIPHEEESISHDPLQAAMPPGVKLLTGAFRTALPGFWSGAVYTGDTSDHSVANIAKEQRAGVVRQIVRTPRPNRITDAVTTPDNGFEMFKAKVGRGIVLRNGQGLALVGGRAGILDNSQFNYFDMRVVFVHRPAATYPVIGNNRIVRVL